MRSRVQACATAFNHAAESRADFSGQFRREPANTESKVSAEIGGVPPVSQALRSSIRRLMNTTAHDFVTVDMRGLKAALVARAQAERLSVSVLVRAAVARDLGVPVEGEPGRVDSPTLGPSSAASVKLSIRMTNEEALQLAAGARASGLSRGAYLAGLIANVPVLSSGASRPDHIATLVASCAELSTLSRNIHRLTALLRQADVDPAKPYRAMLDTLAGDVHRHLKLAAAVLADLQPQGRAASGATRPHR